MKSLKIVGGIIAALIVLFIGVAFVLPSKYEVKREADIAATPETVFDYVGDFSRWNEWSPWAELDPEMKVTVEGAAGMGQKSSWNGPKAGNGSMTASHHMPPNMLEYDLEFNDGQMKSKGGMNLTASADGKSTHIVWSDAGDVGMNPIGRYFAMAMDGMIGPDFEKGLAKLKTLAEKTQVDKDAAAAAAAAAAATMETSAQPVTPTTEAPAEKK